jgi:hypothetical protein
LRRPVALAALGVPLLGDPALAAFLHRAVGERRVPLGAFFLSAAFDLATGVATGVKVDVCCHCVEHSVAVWAEILAETTAAVGLPGSPMPSTATRAAFGRVDLEFVGLGVDRHRRFRLNVYCS